ncbi:protein NRT1/ PTR FAMILY 5.5-like [Corylus avellana]|uniref:protein NRT1/ PTR FAMILY 5.5-like n=1 Tax=Corylus avellana TaxID=13451 RepID=UPI00286D5A9E|nr:protein NRT1/ PTR FAMILY 5.5-like [Corylus avellana]
MAGTIFHHSSFHFLYSFLSKKPAVSIMLQTFPRFCGSNLDLNFQNDHSILRDSIYKFLNTLLVLAHQAVANQEVFTLGYARADVLEWAGRLAEYALWSRMTYLTDVWGLDTTHAAVIVNVCKGVETLMPIGMAFIADAFMGNYCMLLFSSHAYSLGMIFLAMSTPPVLSKFAGNCGEYESNCIGGVQIILFYLSLLFIARGVSGHAVSLTCFLEQQKPIKTRTGRVHLARKRQKKYKWLYTGLIISFIFTSLLSFMLSSMAPWSIQFGIPATGMVVATLLFMSGSDSYIHAEPQGSSLTTVSRVFVASASKLFCPLPRDANQLHENRHSSECVPHTQGLRCLDKAAIVVSTKIENLEQQEQNRWKLCSKIAELMFATVTKKLIEKGSRKCAAPVGNIVAMIFSILCCMTAAIVETRRLDVIKSHGLTDKPNEKIPMSMFWLLPQFLLLGALDGISHNILVDRDKISGFSIACFFNGEVPDSISSYLQIFSDSVFGIGIWGGVVLVCIVDKVKPSWFQKTSDKSRLDNYYWTLTVLSFITFVFSILVAIWYNYQHSAIEEIRTPESQSSAQT